jgi:hypothetical protein
MMRRLKLDFQRKSANMGGGVVLLAIALLVGGILFSEYRDLADEIDEGEAKLTRLERLTGHKVESPGKHDANPYGEEIKRANEVIDQLALPWDQLFAAVEGAAGKDVALLAIQPDKRKREVTIGGEAKNVAAMLDYMRRLNESKPLRKVDLLSHQIQQQDPQKPVRFNLSAKWIVD